MPYHLNLLWALARKTWKKTRTIVIAIVYALLLAFAVTLVSDLSLLVEYLRRSTPPPMTTAPSYDSYNSYVDQLTDSLTADQIKLLLQAILTLKNSKVDTPLDNREEFTKLKRFLTKIEIQHMVELYGNSLHTLMNTFIEKDNIFAGIKTGHLAFSKPERMAYKSSSKIQLVISADQIDQPAKNYLSDQLKGKIQEEDIKITRYISAELSASNTEFDIQPKGPQTKDISGPQPSSWIWDVTPIAYGKEKQLTVEVLGYLQSEDIPIYSPPHSLRVFITSFDVDIKAWDWVLYQLNHIQSVWAMPAAILGGSWAVFIFLRQSKPQPKKLTESSTIAASQQKRRNK